MVNKPKIRRSTNERIAALDQKVKFHQEKIGRLEKQKKDILNPPQKKKSKNEALNEIYKVVKASGKTLDDVIKLLKAEE